MTAPTVQWLVGVCAARGLTLDKACRVAGRGKSSASAMRGRKTVMAASIGMVMGVCHRVKPLTFTEIEGLAEAVLVEGGMRKEQV